MPQAAKSHINEETCQVRFYIDTKGIPEKIEILKCSKIFHASLMEVLKNGVSPHAFRILTKGKSHIHPEWYPALWPPCESVYKSQK